MLHAEFTVAVTVRLAVAVAASAEDARVSDAATAAAVRAFFKVFIWTAPAARRPVHPGWRLAIADWAPTSSAPRLPVGSHRALHAPGVWWVADLAECPDRLFTGRHAPVRGGPPRPGARTGAGRGVAVPGAGQGGRRLPSLGSALPSARGGRRPSPRRAGDWRPSPGWCSPG